MKYFSRSTLLALISISVLVSTAAAQRRDFVTEQEGELIREAQEIDLRIEALTKFIDRRLPAANIAGHTWTPPKKNSELWGPEPTGSRSELLSDIKRLLQKSIDDIDDIASRTSTAIEGNEVGVVARPDQAAFVEAPEICRLTGEPPDRLLERQGLLR